LCKNCRRGNQASTFWRARFEGSCRTSSGSQSRSKPVLRLSPIPPSPNRSISTWSYAISYELYGCNRTEHTLLRRDSNPQAPAHRCYRSASFTPGRAGARLERFSYRLPQTRSIFQFNSWIFVSSSRKRFDNTSICCCNCGTGTVATNLTSDLEYLSCLVLAASATLQGDPFFCQRHHVRLWHPQASPAQQTVSLYLSD
jgi:hypothetical protein